MDFQPSNLQFAWWWESLPGVPGRGTRHDLEIAGETAGNTEAPIERTAITRAGMKPAPLAGKLTTSPELTIDAFNPFGDWFYLASLFGGCSTTEPETGAFLHRFSRTEDETIFPKTCTLGFDRDDGMPERFTYGRMFELAFNFAQGALAGFKAKAATVAGDYWADAVRSAGAGDAFPALRGLIDSQFDETATTENVHIDIVSSTLTTVTFKAKVGDAAAFDGANQTATRGVWTRISDEDDVLQGTLGMPLEINFPVAGTFAADDVISFARRLSTWVPSYPDKVAVNEVYSVITVDGVAEEIGSMGLTINYPAAATATFGGQRARRTRQRGQQTVSGTLQREALSVAMRRRLEMAKLFEIETYLRTGVVIGTTGNLDAGLRLRMAACKPGGTTPSVTDRDTYDESISFTAHPSDDVTDPEDIAAYLYNDIEDLAAA